MAAEESLRQAWLVGVEGRLSGREQAKAWALREVWLVDGRKPYGMFEFVASRTRKTHNGKPIGDHPSTAAVLQLFSKVDNDSAWFPGKHAGEKRGPERVLSGAKRAVVASAAKRLKREGLEPTLIRELALCGPYFGPFSIF